MHFQSSAARPQGYDRNWCKLTIRSSRRRLRDAEFRLLDRVKTCRRELIFACENRGIPASGFGI
jgi:hypothetical protein